MARVDHDLVALLQDIASHRKRTGEPASWRAFWGMQPVWLPPRMPRIIVESVGRAARR
jgi:hypothetical protein